MLVVKRVESGQTNGTWDLYLPLSWAEVLQIYRYIASNMIS